MTDLKAEASGACQSTDYTDGGLRHGRETAHTRG